MPDTPPRQAYTAGALQIVQTPGYVFFMTEQLRTYRVIPTAPRPHVGSNIHLFMGDSRGRWEGNTLVVDVTNLKDRVWFDHVGNTFSESAHLVERWTMFHQDAVHYQATLDDPKVFTRPWTMAFGWRRNTEPGFEILESACWEGIQEGQRRLQNELKEYRGGFSRRRPAVVDAAGMLMSVPVMRGNRFGVGVAKRSSNSRRFSATAGTTPSRPTASGSWWRDRPAQRPPLSRWLSTGRRC